MHNNPQNRLTCFLVILYDFGLGSSFNRHFISPFILPARYPLMLGRLNCFPPIHAMSTAETFSPFLTQILRYSVSVCHSTCQTTKFSPSLYLIQLHTFRFQCPRANGTRGLARSANASPRGHQGSHASRHSGERSRQKRESTAAVCST